MSTFNYAGQKVWYEESGQGDPIVFLHNGGNDHRIWDHQVAHFSKRNRVIVVDHLGHGNSDCPSIDYTLPLFTGEVEALIRELALDRPTLVGNCIGAAMALHYTLAHPASVGRLVLFNLATEKTLLAGPLADVYRGFSASPEAREVFIRSIEENGMPADQTTAGLQSQLGSSHTTDDPEFAAYTHRLYNKKGQMRTLYNNLSQFASFAVLDRCRRPDGFPPLLLIWGASNQILPPAASQDVRVRLRPDRCEVFEGGGHLLMRERPAEINAMIESFLRQSASLSAGTP